LANTDTESLKSVKQPLPLPQGVENSAIGFRLSIKGVSNLVALQSPFYKTYWFWTAVVLLVILGLLWLLYRRGITGISLWMISMVFVLGSSCTSEPELQSFPLPNNLERKVTFILGEDRGEKNPYFQNAHAYFSTDSVEGTPLVVTSCASMLEVRNWLEANAPAHAPWQHINLVVHGNQWTGINVPVLPEGERCSAQSLGKLVSNGGFKPLPDRVVSKYTHIAVFGCDVGKDELLLNRLAIAFGGQDEHCPVVSSARYFNIFEKRGSAYGRHLAENYFTTYPPGQFPGNQTLALRLQQKYPDVAINWLQALLSLEPKDDKSPYVHYFYIPVEWMVAYPNEKKRPKPDSEEAILKWVKQQPDLMKKLAEMQLPADRFLWEVKEEQYEGHPVLVAKGLSIIYCILNPVVDQHQEYVRTTTDDPRYYAMSH